MKSGEIDGNWFEIQSDNGQMIGGASVFERKRVVVSAVETYQDFDPLSALTPEIQAFAEVEARRLGLVDD